nr:hypothetical protein [Enterobacter roggenkampii]
MSEVVVLRVLEVPGLRSKAWRLAIAERCRLAGWDYLDYGGNAPPMPKAGRNTVIVGWNLDDAIEGARWCVLTAEPSQAVAAFRELHGRSESEALYHVASGFAQATHLAARGAQVWRDTDPVLEVPGLGAVFAKGDAEPPVPSAGPLALYAAIPLASEARAEWPAVHFNYQELSAPTSGPMTIGLLGRRRLLFNGPNIALPSGAWTARAALVLGPHSAADVLIEWGYGHDVTPLRTILKTPGRYEVEITHDWKTPAPADFRISLMMPCLDGALTFEGLTVERSPSQKDAAASV